MRDPGEGEVKLRVQAVGLNRSEAGFMRGRYCGTPELPSRIGYEAAGIVEAVGPGVDPSWVGKQIATVPGYSMSKNGVLGEEAIVPADSLGEYTAKLSPVEGAAIWMQYLTAYGALVTFGGVEARGFRADYGGVEQRWSGSDPDSERGRRDTDCQRREDPTRALNSWRWAPPTWLPREEEDVVTKVNEITGGIGARLVFDPSLDPAWRSWRGAGGISWNPLPCMAAFRSNRRRFPRSLVWQRYQHASVLAHGTPPGCSAIEDRNNMFSIVFKTGAFTPRLPRHFRWHSQERLINIWNPTSRWVKL